MTVQLKPTAVRKAVKTLIADSTELPVLFLAKGMEIDLEAGTVTLKFKPNGQPTPKTIQNKSKKQAADSDVSGLEFARGEKAGLRREYKANIAEADNADIKVNMFGKVIELNGKTVMIIGFENGKFRVRKEDGKVINGAVRTVLTALSGEAPAKKPKKAPKKSTKKPSKKTKKADKKTGKQQASSGTKQSNKSGGKLVTGKVTGKNPFTPAKKKELQAKFKKAAKGLTTKGISAGLFWKPIEIGGKVYRIIAASVKQEKVRLLNVKTGKTAVMEVSAVFPLSN